MLNIPARWSCQFASTSGVYNLVCEGNRDVLITLLIPARCIDDGESINGVR